MFCGECGTQNPDSNQFCRNCGKPLIRRQPAAQATEPPVPRPETFPAAQPVPVPAAPVQPPVIPTASAQVPATAPKRTKNWLGIVSLISGILSWGILTNLLAIGAILLGIAGTVLFRKATGRIGISGIIGVFLGIAAIAVTTVLA